MTTIPVASNSTNPVAAAEAETVAVALATIEAALTNSLTPVVSDETATSNLIATLEKLAADQTGVAATLTVLAPTALSMPTPDLAATETAASAQIAMDIAATLTAKPQTTPTPNLGATQTAATQQIATAVISTLVAQPTATRLLPLPRDTSTLTPTETSTPAPPPLAFHPISLSQIANASTETGYVAPPLGVVELHGVLFDLPRGQNSVTTQAESLPSYPIELVLSNVNITMAQQVYLLITGGNTRIQFEDIKIGEVDLVFSNNQHFITDLVPGRNLREWKIYGDHNVTWTSATNISEVWQTPNHDDSGLGIIDLLMIIVPPQLRDETLLEIRIYDQSQATVGSMDPAINLLGVTVFGQE